MPAVSRYGVAACLWMACWTGKGTTGSTVVTESTTRDVSGSYWCTFVEGDYDDARQPCLIKRVNDKLVLARLSGSERFHGQITLDESEGFRFAGEIYCPWGECEQSELHGRFKPAGRGGFRASFKDLGLVIQLVPAPAGAFGGTAYGGNMYGGDPFDLDGGFGGRTYGSRRRYGGMRRP
jgi:hypothetical protein